jgi:hypothetical protein
MATPADVIKLASAYATEHYKESANNDSIFGKWYGMNNAPWCAMFVSYCFNKVGAGALVAAGNPKGFASCTTGLRWFEGHKRLVPTRNAVAGDVVFFNFSGGKTPEHVGIVISNDPKNKVLHTVEGNTVNPNGKGQANGDGVYFKTRPYGYVVGVAAPNWPAVAKPAA